MTPLSGCCARCLRIQALTLSRSDIRRVYISNAHAHPKSPADAHRHSSRYVAGVCLHAMSNTDQCYSLFPSLHHRPTHQRPILLLTYQLRKSLSIPSPRIHTFWISSHTCIFGAFRTRRTTSSRRPRKAISASLSSSLRDAKQTPRVPLPTQAMALPRPHASSDARPPET